MPLHFLRFRKALCSATFLAATLLVVLTWLPIGQLLAASPVYEYRDSSGAVVFSDAPRSDDGLVRTAYLSEYGRKPATASCRGQTAASLKSRLANITPLIQQAAARHGVDARLIQAVARVESCFHVHALSRAGAQGVMQLMPPTAAELGVQDAYNAAQNIDAGARYLAWLITRYPNKLDHVLAAYNAGPGNVDRHGGIPPFKETQKYVVQVRRQLQKLQGVPRATQADSAQGS